MHFLECDLEKIIMETDNDILNSRGLPIKGYKRSQVRIGNYGRSDIISFERSRVIEDDGVLYDKPAKFTIYELKKDFVDVSTFIQSISYLKGLKNYLWSKYGRSNYAFSVCLIGRSVDTSTPFCYLPSLIYGVNLSYYKYDYSIDGLTFHEQNNFDLIEKGF